jgi:predicted neutral ceramidase superfamily lipid hydrolase
MLVYDQGVSSFLLNLKLASNLASVQESISLPIKTITMTACVMVAIGFTLPIIACLRHDLQDLITQILCACAFAASFVSGIMISYFQYRIIGRLLVRLHYTA